MNGTGWCKADLWDQTFHRWPIIERSLFSGHLPWALGVWFAEVLKPFWLQLNPVEAVMSTWKVIYCSGLWGRGGRPYMSQTGLWKFLFPCLKTQPHVQVNTAWQAATSQMITLQFPRSKWEINPFILTSGDCAHLTWVLLRNKEHVEFPWLS